MEVIILLLGILGLGTGAGFMVIRNLYYICQPSEVLIFAGTSKRTSDNRKIGYRLVKGGSSIRRPLLEKTFRMDLTNIIIELKVSNAYSKGGIPLKVEGVANIKIAGEEPIIHNAIERLLGKSRQEIERFAKETLEGNLRGVLASLTPEQVNEDKIAFAKSLLEEAEDDLEKLGLVLDNLQIQNISDDVSYLDSIGRKQQADLLRDARIAEAQAQSESAIKAAENEKITALRRIDRDIEITKAEAELRVKNALTKREAVVAEAEAEIAAKVVKRQAEVAVQTERIKQVQQQLQADVVAPAEASCKKAISQAKGEAASIIEDGKAQVEGIKSLAESWKSAGTSAKEIFLFQKLDVLLKTLATAVPEVDVQNVTVIDAQGGSTATKMASFLEELRQTTGMDVAEVVSNLTTPKSKPIEQNSVPYLNSAEAKPKESVDKKITPPPKTTPFTPESSQLNPFSKLKPSTPEIPKALPVDNALKSEIKQYLDKLALNNSSDTVAEQSIKQIIDRYPKLKQRLKRTLDVGGEEALKLIFTHPLIHIPTRMIEVWIEEDNL
ncbi:MAG: flotillin family protein [Moorea sp. SIO2B7]|nr:flotillin family protein [Moorena sp. SIO2B7]